VSSAAVVWGFGGTPQALSICLPVVQGLGKTLQSVAFIAALLGKIGRLEDGVPVRPRQPKPFLGDLGVRGPAEHPADRCPILVTAPVTLLSNWEREFEMWGAAPLPSLDWHALLAAALCTSCSVARQFSEGCTSGSCNNPPLTPFLFLSAPPIDGVHCYSLWRLSLVHARLVLGVVPLTSAIAAGTFKVALYHGDARERVLESVRRGGLEVVGGLSDVRMSRALHFAARQLKMGGQTRGQGPVLVVAV
jgi:SNF2-related domain